MSGILKLIDMWLYPTIVGCTRVGWVIRITALMVHVRSSIQDSAGPRLQIFSLCYIVHNKLWVKAMPSTTFTVRVDSGVKKRLEKLAKNTGRSRSFLAAEAITE